jgi:hypothetical protein
MPKLIAKLLCRLIGHKAPSSGGIVIGSYDCGRCGAAVHPFGAQRSDTPTSFAIPTRRDPRRLSPHEIEAARQLAADPKLAAAIMDIHSPEYRQMLRDTRKDGSGR